MKAKEYYAKYKEQILSADDKVSLRAVSNLVCDLSVEAKELLQKRHAQSNCAGVAVLREMNDKYNAICNLFEREYGATPIKPNGFMLYWKRTMPELEKYLERRGKEV